jgi:hypothetical protein
MLQGEINVENESPVHMVLRGPRVHSWEQRELDLGFHRSVAVSIFMDDGTMIKMNGASDRNGLTE